MTESRIPYTCMTIKSTVAADLQNSYRLISGNGVISWRNQKPNESAADNDMKREG